MNYLHLKPQSSLPTWAFSSPYQAVLVIDAKVSLEWQEELSKWLVETGCLYMMAWGNDCSSWDDSVDMANMEAYDFKHIPESSFVMTTWHEKEPLSDVFWFVKYSALIRRSGSCSR